MCDDERLRHLSYRTYAQLRGIPARAILKLAQAEPELAVVTMIGGRKRVIIDAEAMDRAVGAGAIRRYRYHSRPPEPAPTRDPGACDAGR